MDSNPQPSITCQICLKEIENLETFQDCLHHICPLCLFRLIFLHNINELTGTATEINIHCPICKKGKITKTLDEIVEINNKKQQILMEVLESHTKKEVDKFCNKHGNSYLNYYCVDCFKIICKTCSKEKDNEHFEHRIVLKDKIVRLIKNEIKEIPLKFQTKELFESNFDSICNKIKQSTENNYNITLTQIDELVDKITKLRDNYITYYKSILRNIVNTMRIIKLFYLDFYLQKDESYNSYNIDLLRYVNSIKQELTDVEFIKDESFINIINNCNSQINELENQFINFKCNFKFSKLTDNFKCETVLLKEHNKLINSIIETKDEKLVSASLDFSMIIWEEKETGFQKVNTIQGECGAIVILHLLKNNKLITTAANNNNINIWDENKKGSYVIKQSLSSHNNPVVSIAELNDDKFISGSLDSNLIIWEKDDFDNYFEVQRIENKKPIIKIISLKNNNFAYTTAEDGNIKIMKYKENNYSINCILKKHVGRVKTMIELKNNYIISCGDISQNKNDKFNILLWKPNDLESYYHKQSIKGHIAEINSIIELVDGRLATASKDRTIRLWKAFFDNKNELQYMENEVLSEYSHGMYCLLQLKDGRLCSTASDNSIVIWRNRTALC